MDMPVRRSRMRRSRTGKRLELTARDIEIFKLLDRYRYLPSTYIHAFVGGASSTRFKERLGDLFHEGYVDRPSQQWDFADARHSPAVYETGAGAARALFDAGIMAGDRRTFLSETAHRQYRHSLMICQILASLDLGVRAVPGLRFIAWPEMVGRAPEATRSSGTPFRLPVPSGGYLVPDGLFGLAYTQGGIKSYRFFALEADRGTMPIARSSSHQTSYLGKIAAYREIIAHRVYKTHLGLPNFLVLTITTGEARMADIIRRLCSQTSDNAAFLFKAVNASGHTTPAPHLLLEPWPRAGFAPLCIADASAQT